MAVNRDGRVATRSLPLAVLSALSRLALTALPLAVPSAIARVVVSNGPLVIVIVRWLDQYRER